MKKIIFTCLAISYWLFTSKNIDAQNIKFYSEMTEPSKTWVLPMDTSKKVLGPVYLYELDDSSITVCNNRVRSIFSICEKLNIPIFDISQIKIKDKSKSFTNSFIGLLIGAAVGFGIGYPIGYSQGDDPPLKGFGIRFTAVNKGAIGGTLLGICGATAGAIAGANIKIEIPIYSDFTKYNLSKEKLRKYSMKK